MKKKYSNAFLLIFTVLDLLNKNYSVYHKKYLRSKISTHTTISVSQCLMLCSLTDGCYAANVHGNHDVICELTSGLSNEEEMLDDPTKTVYIRGLSFTIN